MENRQRKRKSSSGIEDNSSNNNTSSRSENNLLSSPPTTTTTTTTTTNNSNTNTPSSPQSAPSSPYVSIIRTRSQIAAANAAAKLNQESNNNSNNNNNTSELNTPTTKKQKNKKKSNSTPSTPTTTTTTTTSTSANSTSKSSLSKRKKSTPTKASETKEEKPVYQPLKKRMTSKKLSQEMEDSNKDEQMTTTGSTSSQEDNNNNNNNSTSSFSNTGIPSPTSSLQGLMRGITGALMDELASSGGFRTSGGARDGLINTLIEGRARLKQILSGLKSDDESQQMESLIELSDLLSIATEDTMAGFPSESFAPALVNLLNMEHNPDMMLLSCRAMSNMIEALPGSVSSVVNHGGIVTLIGKLLSIEYIDLAEQSLQTLEKISLEQPTAVLRAGGLMAVLSYLDFFSTGVQRVALSTAANICRQIPQDCFEMINDSIPILSNLLTYSDAKVIELSCLCFSRLVDSFYDSETKLQTITSDGLIAHLVRILSGMNTSTITLSPTTYTQIIRILSSICHGCPPLTRVILQEGIANIIQSILCPSDSDSGSITRSNQQSYEILSLINELLPPLPSEFGALMSNQRSLRKKKENSDKEDARIEIYREQPELLTALGKGLFIVLVEMFTSTVNPAVRYKCLGSICKILYFSTADMLTELLKHFAFSSFLAGLLGSRDMTIVSNALKISEMMLEKLPSIFERYFKREGVIYEIDRLSKLEPIINTEPAITGQSPSPTKSHSSSPISIPTTPQRGIPPPLASSPFGANSFFVGSPMHFPPNTPSSSSNPSPLSTQVATASVTSPADDMKSFVCKEARRFKEKYFSKDLSSVDSLSTDELKSLKSLSDRLYKCYNEAGIEVLQEISDCITTKEGVSAFEFLHSGLVSSILSYLTRGDVKNHVECFCKVFLVPYKNERALMTSSSPMKASYNQTTILLSLLVQKLHDALTKVERFAININEVGGTSSGLKYLAQPFKLKLVKDGGDELLKDYSSNVVLIEPLATITAIEEFLTSRVIQKPTDAAVSTPSKTDTSSPKTSTPIHSSTSIKEKSDEEDEDDDYHDDYEDDELLQNNDEPNEGESEPVHDVKVSDASLSLSGSIPAGSAAGSTSTTSTTTTTTTTTTTSNSASSSSLSTSTQPQATSPMSTSPPHTPLSASTSGVQPATQKLAIFVDGQRLLPTLTIFQAVQKIAKSTSSLLVSNNNNNNNNSSSSYGIDQSNEASIPTNRLWEGTHTLKYRYLSQSELEQPNSQQSTTATTKPSIKSLGESSIVSFLEDGHTFPLSSNDTTYEIISLLRILYTLNFNTNLQTTYNFDKNSLSQSEFISQKLTAKVMRQLQDPLALCGGALPDWCKQLLTYCPFLFPFECKRLFFYSTSFGIARALSTLQQRQDLIRQTHDSRSSQQQGEVRVGRIQRQKVRIYRNRILESAVKVMELYGKTKSILEVEYFGEVGTGLGPTLEFFTLVSREVQRKDLNLWFSDSDSLTASSTDSSSAPAAVQYVYNAGGLFPKPMIPGTIPKKTLDYFKFLGTFVAKAFFDQRLVDLPLSKPFYKYMTNKDISFEDLKVIAPSLHNSLANLYTVVLKIKEINSNNILTDQEKQTEISKLRIDGATIEDLCLDFVLPGYPTWELKENGSNIGVTLNNLEEYINLVVMNFLYSGVIQQIDAFKEGFNQIFAISSLNTFSIQEVESLLCGSLTGSDNDWTVDSLMESTKCDHGYTNSSIAVQNFFKILSEFNTEERKQFLLFITGSPHLPIQGFKGLNPRLTIVKKHNNPPTTADDSLLSVMSCTNYIKLPDYSTKDTMKTKLLYAMKEGQNSFNLS